MIWILFLAAVWVVLLLIVGSYNLQVAGSGAQIATRVAIASAGTGLVYLVLFFFFGRPPVLADGIVTMGVGSVADQAPPRLATVLFLALGLTMLVGWRLSYVRFFTSPALRRRAVIVGANQAGRVLVRDTGTVLREYEFVGFIDVAGEDSDASLPLLGDHQTLKRLIEARAVDEIVVAHAIPLEGELFQALTYGHERGIRIKPMSQVYEELLGQVPVEHLGPHWFLHASNAVFPTVDRILKRGLDIAVGLVGLLLLLLALPLLALAIYLDSPGPIFYGQERSGRGGRPFRVLKFRSMVPNAEQVGAAQWAAKGDPRITRVGRFLRRTRLDELPQVLNILKGDMSLVGPRPERPQFVAQLEQQIPFYRSRLSVKPGLTGWAQVCYRYGSSVEDALVKLKYDLYYIKHQSFLLDLVIIVRTVAVVLACKGT